jgi:glycogen operon protein
MLSNLTSRLIASPDIYGHRDREPEQSINFITCHDGFTLNDLVSYHQKHNEANGEGNRDGNNHNLSWNCGAEGPTDNEAVEALRNRQVKNFLTITLISLGVPMLLMGDEVRRTQRGNNNAYCHDSELTWFDWSLPGKHADIHRFVKILIAHRLKRDTALQKYSMNVKELLKSPLLTWHGVKLHNPDWSDHSLSVAFTVRSLRGSVLMHYMINSYSEPLEFELPPANGNGAKRWQRWIDTSLPSPQDICYWDDATDHNQQSYTVQPHSIAILISRLNTKST